MFEMTVEEVVRVGSVIVALGPCNSVKLFKSPLIDENMKEIKAAIPIGKDLGFVDDYIGLQLYDVEAPEMLEGKTLKSLN